MSFPHTFRLLGVLLALLFGVVSCVPDNRYDSGLDPFKMTRKELSGTWRGWEGSLLKLSENGEAEVKDLDGQDWAFEDNWRMSGKGRWKLFEAGESWGPALASDGQHVEVTITSDGTTKRDDDVPEGRSENAPEKYTWLIRVGEEDGRATLYFFTGDPDVRNYYKLWK